MGNNLEFFTFSFYKQITDLLKDKGFTFCFFNQTPEEKKVYLRHDLDFSVAKACEMASFEKDLGIRSTYFVMLNNPLYNVFYQETRKMLQNILQLGHAIGLHFALEETEDLTSLEKLVQNQCRILADVIESPVDCFSVHRPAYWSDKGFSSSSLLPPSLINTYATPFFSQGHYISDSNHNWRCGEPLKFISEYEGNSLQVLTHPIWWNQELISPRKKAENYLSDLHDHASNFLKNNISVLNTPSHTL